MQRKAKDDIPQRGNSYTECYPIKAPSSVLPQAFPLKKKKKSFFSVFLHRSYLFAHASAGVCFVLVLPIDHKHFLGCVSMFKVGLTVRFFVLTGTQ